MRSCLIRCALSGATLLAAACGGAKAQVLMPDAVPLVMPDAPARIVVPAAPDPAPPPVIESPAHPTSPPVTPGGAGRTRVDPPPARATAPPPTPPTTSAPATPPSAPTPLETTANPSALEKEARDLVASANVTLDKIDPKSLNADGRTQYDIAKRFLQQADAALKAKNIVYAWQLADKANTIATLLK